MLFMKKIILFTLASTLALAASAQSWQDALLFSENEYAGTARSVAMGNALPEVKAAADVSIGSNDEDGIADYLDSLSM